MIDVLYVHPLGNNPSFSLKYIKKKTAAEHFFGFIPMGTVGVVNNLIKNKVSVKGVNLPLKKRVNPNFSLSECLDYYKPSIVLMDMQWYVHIKNGLEIAKECRKRGIKVIVGGISATIFYKQLVEYVDYVIKGDAEKPILDLVKKILGNKKITSGSNIACKEFDGSVDYVCTDIDNYDYVNLDFLEDKESYLNMFDFWLLVGKGCPYDCENCDGARHATKGIFGRERTLFRKPGKIISDLKKIHTETVNFSLDLCIMPDEVIDKIAKERFRLNLRNEFFQLANIGKLKKLKKSFRSFDFVFSPVSGDDSEKKEYGRKFNNSDFLKMLKSLEEEDFNGGVIVYFTDYLISPLKTKKLDVKARKELIKKIEEITPYALIEVLPQVVDPGTLKDKMPIDKLFNAYSQ